MKLHSIQRLNLQRVHHDFLDDQSGDSLCQIIRKTKSPCLARIDKEDANDVSSRAVLTFFRLSLDWKGKLSSAQKEPILKVPLCHMVRIDRSGDKIILSYVRILHKHTRKNGWVRAHRMLLELDFTSYHEADSFKSAVFEHFTPITPTTPALIGEPFYEQQKKKVLVIYNEQSGTAGTSAKIINRIVRPLLEAANITYGLLSTQYALHAKLIGNRITFAHNTLEEGSPHVECKHLYDACIIVGGDGLIHEVVNGLMSRHHDWYNKQALLCIIPSGTSNALARNLGLSCPVWACWALIRELGFLGSGDPGGKAYLMGQRGQRKHLGIMAIDQDQGEDTQDDRRFYSHLSITYGLLADIDLGGDQHRWMGRDRMKWMALKKVSALTTYPGVTIKYLPFVGADAENNASNNSPPPPFDTKTKRPMLRWKNELKNSSNAKLIETSLFSLMALKQSYIDRDLVIDKGMYEREVVEDEDGGVDLFILKGRKQRALISKALLAGDLTPLNSDPSSYFRVSCMEISFPPPPAYKNNTDGLLSIDGEGYTPAPIYLESIPNIIPFICSDDHLKEMSSTNWYLGQEEGFSREVWEEMRCSLLSTDTEDNTATVSNNSFLCCFK